MFKKISFLLALLFCNVGYSEDVIKPSPPKLNFGRIEPTAFDKEAARLSKSPALSKLVKYNDESDALPYRIYFMAKEKAGLLTELEKRTGRLASLDQGDVGSCVGYGNTKALQITAACDVYLRKEPEAFIVDFNPDAIYAITRMDNLGQGDGSTGIWAVEGFNKYGTLHKKDYGSISLVQTKPRDGRTWATRGLPDVLLEAAKDHKVISSSLITSLDEAKAAIQNGYGISLCANISYSTTRDRDGFSARTREGWAHCMACIGYRGPSSGKEGFLIANSWGGPEGTWIDGPIYPDDMPYGSFWVTPENLMAHLREQDSYALSGYKGFVRRQLKWEEVLSIGDTISN